MYSKAEILLTLSHSIDSTLDLLSIMQLRVIMHAALGISIMLQLAIVTSLRSHIYCKFFKTSSPLYSKKLLKYIIHGLVKLAYINYFMSVAIPCY